MPVVAQDQRMSALRKLGLSEPLLRLALGECIHELFRGNCLGPPYYAYQGAAVPSVGSFLPLWDHGDVMVGLVELEGHVAFAEQSIETPGVVRHVAYSESGFWASRFDFLYECDVMLDELRQAAVRVQFREVERYLAARSSAETSLGTFSSHSTWLRDVIDGIDVIYGKNVPRTATPAPGKRRGT